MRIRHLACAALALLAATVQAGPPLDGMPVVGWGNMIQPGMSKDKFSTDDISLTHDFVRLDDGSILLAVEYSIVDVQASVGFTRLHPDGTLDMAFGQNGYAKPALATVATEIEIFDLERDAVGRVYIGGTSADADHGLFVCRVDPDSGALMAFIPMGPVCSVAGQPGDFFVKLLIQSDSKLVLAAADAGNGNGGGAFRVTRFLPDGTLDPTYGNGGTAMLPIVGAGAFPVRNSAALASNDKLVLALTHYAAPNNVITPFGRLFRLTTAGIPDESWVAADPKPGVSKYVINAIVLESRHAGNEDDVVLLGAPSLNSATGFIWRLRGDTGVVDPSFGKSSGHTDISATDPILKARLVPRAGGGYFGVTDAAVQPISYLGNADPPFFAFALDRAGAIDLSFGSQGYAGFPESLGYGSSLMAVGDSVFLAGGFQLGDDSMQWFVTRLGIDRLFQHDFDGP